MLYRSCAALAVMTLLTSCGATITGGTSAACDGYAEERQHMPDAGALSDEWLQYVVRVDTRLTAICR